jgi:hypothetical protein
MKTHPLLILGISVSLLTAGCATSWKTAKTFQPPSVEPTAAADLLIISATYGSGTNYSDVTARVNDLLRQPDVEFFASPKWLGADPTPGWNKALVIVYEFKGHRHVFTAGENGAVTASALMAAAE